jgi:hypothetical protein
MTSVDYHSEATQLVQAISKKVSADGVEIAEQMTAAADLLMEWLGYLHQSEMTDCCDTFLEGIRSLVLEAVASATAGLYRSALFALRAQVDLTLSWLYFKDHPIEWAKVERESEGFKLKKDVFIYLTDHYPAFTKKFSTLEAAGTRADTDTYRILSAHIHSIGPNAMHLFSNFSDVVGDKQVCIELVELQADVAEYLNDVLVAVYGFRWASLPDPIVKPIRDRLSQEKLALIFS